MINENTEYNNYINDNNTLSNYSEIGNALYESSIYPTFNIDQDISLYNGMFTTMICWNCLSVLLIKKDWVLTRCGECQKINRIPHDNPDSGEQIGQDPYLFKNIKCPFCNKLNQIKKNVQRVTCYNCAFSFNINDYQFTKINPIENKQKPVINKNILQFIPQYYPQHNCENQSMKKTLSKILDSLKVKRKRLVPYPILPFIPYNPYENERYSKKEERVPIYIKESEPKEDDQGFRITIRKKPKKDIYEDNNKMSKSQTIERVYFNK